jgi:RNA-binding protein
MNPQQQKKHYRAIGHQLSPIVTIAGNGLTEQVLTELERALDDHELIKVRITADREDRKQLLAMLLEKTEAEIIRPSEALRSSYESHKPKNQGCQIW